MNALCESQVLEEGNFLISLNGKYKVAFNHTDGNLLIYINVLLFNLN